MELHHRFTVPASVEDTWATFNDIETVASCFPGATVTSSEGDDFKGTCKVKLGPISLTYTGSGTFLERDESAHRFVMEAKGKDKRGNGTAGATVTAVMTPAGGLTDVEVDTDLAITGKPAQFGRGVIEDVSNKLLQQFVTCLESKVGAPPSEPAAEEPVTEASAGPEFAAEPPSGSSGDGVSASGAAAAAAGEPTRKAASSTYAGASAGADVTASGPGGSAAPEQDNALDLGATVLPVLAKAYWKPVLGAVLVLLVLKKLLGRRG